MYRSSRLFLAGVPRVGAPMTPLAVAPRIALANSVRASSTTVADKKPEYQAATSNKMYQVFG